ncbi:MAG: helix-turn-helix transcriptional regulator [Prolixibacteraceae bacterium]
MFERKRKRGACGALSFLLTLRKQLKMSQEEMAERSGVSLGSLKCFENTGKISMDSLLKLMHLLGRLNEFDSLLLVKENLDDVKKLFTE